MINSQHLVPSGCEGANFAASGLGTCVVRTLHDAFQGKPDRPFSGGEDANLGST